MTALVDIFNRALSACGAEGGITDPDENSREAAECRLWYPAVRDNVLRAAPWSSVRRNAALARISSRGALPWSAGLPNPRYAFAYAAPSDLLQPLYLHSFRTFSYDIVGSSPAISTDDDLPILFYSARISDTSQWEPNLALAVTHSLAVYLSIPITGRSQRVQENAQLAFAMIEEAQMQAANSEYQLEETLPDWVLARGYANPAISRFYYPLQSFSLPVAQ